MTQVQQPGNTRSRVSLVVLAAIFIAPIVLAFITYKYRDLVPSETRNFGELVKPAKPLPEFKLKTLSGAAFTLEDIGRKWSYLYIVKNQCDEACKLNLIKMRNARLGQGAEARRVGYYLIFTDKPEQQTELDELTKLHEKITILYAGDSGSKALLDAFKDTGDSNVENARRVYMIDPIGNYMMYYNDGFEAIGIMEDLKFLLKSSQIG